MKLVYSVFLVFFCLTSFAQDFYDINTVQTIEIFFSQSNWDQLLDAEKAGDENYILADSVTINGSNFDSVGVKYKGNSTYNPNQTKNPFHIELDTYKDHIYEAYTDIKLSNVAKDPSFLREVLSYNVIRNYMDAPLSNYANVYVNGDLLGLYSNSESISKKFVNNRFGSKSNTFIKCNPPDGAGPQSNDFPNLVYLGEDSSAYFDAYEIKSDDGWDDLIELCNTLENDITEIESVLDVDKALWMLALNNVLVNLDSYIGAFSQNYYLYQDDFGRFLPVIWDLNESFGQFSMTGSINLRNTAAKQQMTPYLHESESDFPLIQQLLNNPTYKKMYVAHFKTVLLESFDNESYKTTGELLRTVIDDDVQADNNKFFTYNNFLDNFASDVSSGGGGPGGGNTPGIINLMDARTDYLLGLADFTATAPSISDLTLSSEEPLLNQSIDLTANVADANSVVLAYRNVNGAPFTKITMLDDGQSNDGAAGDGIFGASILLSNITTEYYIYAENDNAGQFEPAQAAHEFLTITAASPAVGDIAINEFMASNDNTFADQDGDFDDWIELYNNTSESIDLSGFYLSDNADELLQWMIPEGTVIDANGYLIIWADEDDDQTGLHASFKLSASGESVILSDTSGTIVDQVSYENQETDISFGRFPNGIGDFRTMTATPDAENTIVSTSSIVINEFMASNDTTFADQDGDFDDWIELYNNGTESIDLSGFYLSDDDNDVTQWAFPAGTIVEGNAYLIIWADEDEEQEGLHASFKLSASAETVVLADTSGNIIDQINYENQETDISFGRFPNGVGDFQSMTPTPNAENNISTTSPIVINEFMASNDSSFADQDGDFDDWIELYNNGATSVDLSGFYLSDDAGEIKQWTFPVGTIIEGGGYLIIWADEEEEQDGLHASFKLSASAETVVLADTSGSIVDIISYEDQETDISYGRFPNGVGDFQTMAPTPNAENNMTTSTFNLDQDELINLTISPNPARQSFVISIEGNDDKESRLLIYRIDGRIVHNGTIVKDASFDTTNWSSGMYLINVDGKIVKLIVHK